MSNKTELKNLLREYIEVGSSPEQSNIVSNDALQGILLKKINANIVKLSELASKGDFTGIRSMLEKFKTQAETRLSGMKYSSLEKPMPHDVKSEKVGEDEEEWHREKKIDAQDDKEEQKKKMLRQKVREQVRLALGGK